MMIVAVTSVWKSQDRQIDTAWAITRVLSVWWAEDSSPEGGPDWSAGLRLTSSGVTFECSAEFMQRLGNTLASRADWLDECSV